jgi:hypothetical protein
VSWLVGVVVGGIVLGADRSTPEVAMNDQEPRSPVPA